MPTDSRDNMIRATVDLLRERGYAGTSLGDILARSGGPRTPGARYGVVLT